MTDPGFWNASTHKNALPQSIKYRFVVDIEQIELRYVTFRRRIVRDSEPFPQYVPAERGFVGMCVQERF